MRALVGLLLVGLAGALPAQSKVVFFHEMAPFKQVVVGRWAGFDVHPTDPRRADSVYMELRADGHLRLEFRRFDGRKGGWQGTRPHRDGSWWVEPPTPGTNDRPFLCIRVGPGKPQPRCEAAGIQRYEGTDILTAGLQQFERPTPAGTS